VPTENTAEAVSRSSHLDGLRTFAPTLDAAWKLGLFVSLLLYSIGLIIATMHAEAYGGNTLELNKTAYVLIGLQWMLQASFGYVIAGQLRRGWLEGMARGKSISNVLKTLAAALLILLLFGAIFVAVVLPLKLGDPFQKPTLVVFVVLIASGFSILFSAEYLRRIFSEASSAPPNLVAMLLDLARYGIYVPMMLIVYSGMSFPLIPKAFGRGAMPAAEIFIKAGSEQTFAHMGLKPNENYSIGTWSIVSELSNAIIITDAKLMSGIDPNTLWLRKDNIEALRYITRPGPSFFASNPPPRGTEPQPPAVPPR